MTTLNIRQLKKVASSLKIKGYSNLRKAELIDAINTCLDTKLNEQHGECCSIYDHPFALSHEEIQDMVLQNATPLDAPPVVEPVEPYPFAIYALAFLLVLVQTVWTYTAYNVVQLLTWLIGCYAAQSFESLNACWQRWRSVNMAIA